MDENKNQTSPDSLNEILDYTEGNHAIFDSYLKAYSVLGRFQHPCCSISGGKDSDIMLDLISRIDKQKKVIYVWFDTGIEYQATKDHLDYLENRYGIKINRERAVKPIPVSCKQYGQPFISKRVSDMIERLQRHDFQWEDDTYENLIKKYPKCQTALGWWTNHFKSIQFNIDYNRYLKDFLVENPPRFKISSKCCEYAKKKVSHRFNEREGCDLDIVGVRKAEGGLRSSAYKNCFTDNNKNSVITPSQYRPLFWYVNDDEIVYDKLFHIQHSDCYTKYGLKRTGCVGCPYGRNLEEELAVM
jgi:3'-phosphoadenosine 5'-phosphosulfate sulfotransferase (PAPS reductase)/FAD synthetase